MSNTLKGSIYGDQSAKGALAAAQSASGSLNAKQRIEGNVALGGGTVVSVKANYNQTNPNADDYIIGRENIAGKADIASATEEALRQAKESGEFDGERGTVIWKIKSVPTSYKTEVGGIKPTSRLPLSTVLSESGASDATELKVGDIAWVTTTHRKILYVDASYVYFDAHVSFKGDTGSKGSAGTSCTHSWSGTTLTVTSASGTSSADLRGEKGDPYTLTDSDKASIVNDVIANVPQETTVKSIAHRGYSAVAPENTIPAYILAKQKGFKYAECDVAFTKDGVAVLLHDDTIDRTSDGSGSISSMTYADVWQYDFGSWKSAEYAGTKIATFEEFIKVCKFIGLHPYIELKSGNYTQAQIESIVDMVKNVGMKGEVTYISFNSTFLGYIKAYDPSATLGFVTFDITSSVVNTASALKTDTNEVFVDCDYNQVTAENVELCNANGMPIEVWTVNSEDSITSLNSYVGGFTSDSLIASKVLCDKYMTYTAPPKPEESQYLRVLTSDEISYRTALIGGNAPHYAETNNSRAAYTKFDIPIVGGCTYKFEWDTDVRTSQVGLQFFTQNALNCVENEEWFGESYRYDPGWQENGVVITVPETHNNSPIVGVRLVFRMDTSNSVVTDGFIQKVYISRVG